MTQTKNKTTTLQSLVNSVRYMNDQGIELTPNGLLVMLENSIDDEAQMIKEIWNDGYSEGSKTRENKIESPVFDAEHYYSKKYSG